MILNHFRRPTVVIPEFFLESYIRVGKSFLLSVTFYSKIKIKLLLAFVFRTTGSETFTSSEPIEIGIAGLGISLGSGGASPSFSIKADCSSLSADLEEI